MAEDGIPEHVAVADTKELTREELANRPEADFRTTGVPLLSRRVAGFHCVHRG